MSDQYESMTKEQLIALIRKRDGAKKLGLVWERDEIAADAAVQDGFVAARLSVGDCDGAGPWDNLVIEGDNLDALKWLNVTHRGRVKCIYIDPPYNTGAKDWVYNDRFIGKEDRWRQSLWLEFLYRRLVLARDLLADDGVMLISINDDQRAKLEMLCDEAMPGMRVGSLVWRTRDTTSAKGRNFSDVHEHVLIYGGAAFEFSGSQKEKKKYKNPDNDPRGVWNVDPLTLAFDKIERPNLFYPLHNPASNTWYPCDPDRVWCFASRSRLKAGQRTQSLPMEEQIEQQLIVFPKDEHVEVWPALADVQHAVKSGNVPVTPRDRKPLILPSDDLEFWVGKRVGFGRPGIKKFWTELRSHIAPLSSWIARKGESDDDELTLLRTGSGGEGTNEIQQIFGSKAFNYPKPVSLVRELIRQATGPRDLVLDFFAGSATTAQAAMELNAEDGGERRFIMVSSTEATADAPGKNLCRDVTAGRIRRLNGAADGRYADLAAPFAYVTMRTLRFEDLDYELAGEEAWLALTALHRMPLTVYRPDAGWQEATDGTAVLILAESTDDATLARLHAIDALTDTTVYTWVPGQFALLMPGLDIRPVRATLARRASA